MFKLEEIEITNDMMATTTAIMPTTTAATAQKICQFALVMACLCFLSNLRLVCSNFSLTYFPAEVCVEPVDKVILRPRAIVKRPSENISFLMAKK